MSSLTLYAAPAVEPLTVSGIYTIRCAKNGKVYVGSSVSIARRWRAHKRALGLSKHHSPHLQRAWDKYGEDAFKLEVIERCTADELLVLEQKYINEFRACDTFVGFNISPVAGSTLGAKLPPFSDAHKRKIGDALRGRRLSEARCAAMSAAQKGKPSGMKGKTFSAEVKAKMSMAKKGKKLSTDHVAKLVIAHTGKKRSAESRANMSLARKGVPATRHQVEAIRATAQKRRKFSDQQLVEIKQRFAENTRIADMAIEFRCSHATLYRIKNNERQAYL